MYIPVRKGSCQKDGVDSIGLGPIASYMYRIIIRNILGIYNIIICIVLGKSIFGRPIYRSGQRSAVVLPWGGGPYSQFYQFHCD